MEYFARIALEHQGIKELLQVQKELLERLNKAKGVNIVHLDNLLYFWRDFLEQDHMSREEEFAFAAFRKLNHSLPERLQGDHEQIRASLGKLEATIKLLRNGRPHSGREYAKWGEELTETVMAHMARENTALREVATDEAEAAAILSAQPERLASEKFNQLLQVAEDLCQEYLQKPTALHALSLPAEAAPDETAEEPDVEVTKPVFDPETTELASMEET